MNNSDKSNILSQLIPKKHQKACMNCTKLHHKCDKIYPTCSHCIKRNVRCIVNPSTKKRGRPFGTTKENKCKKNSKEEIEKQNKILIYQEKKCKDIPKVKQTQRESVSNHSRKKQEIVSDFRAPVDLMWDSNFNCDQLTQTLFEKDINSYLSIRQNIPKRNESIDFDHFNDFLKNPENTFY